jgi:hypothetical protein
METGNEKKKIKAEEKMEEKKRGKGASLTLSQE